MLDIKKIIEEEARFLSDQAPLEYFVHHNTLHHMENHPFEFAVEYAAEQFGKNPYMSLDFYRAEMKKKKVIPEILNEEIDAFITNKKEFNSFLNYLLHEATLTSDIGELRLSSELLDIQAYSTIKTDSFFSGPYHDRIDEALEKMIVFISAYLDQGVSYWRFPENIHKDVLSAFTYYLESSALKAHDIEKSQKLIVAYRSTPEKVISELALNDEKNLRKNIRKLSGWAGMVAKLEREPIFAVRRVPHVSLMDFVFMQLLLQSSIPDPRKVEAASSKDKNLFITYYAHEFHKRDPRSDLTSLAKFLGNISLWELQRIFHRAYERSYIEYILSGLSLNLPYKQQEEKKIQAFFCLDDREESYRRHLEELDSSIETFGAAGFFGIDMQFRSFHAVRPRKLCPPPVTPSKVLEESSQDKSKKSETSVYWYYGHRTLFRTTILSMLQGPLVLLRLKWKLFVPSARQKPVKTKLNLIYTPEEMSLRVATILKSSGLVKDFAPLVAILGHGANSINNPHLAAYRCGACAGGNGAPNARAFAQMANNPEVRQLLIAKHGINISSSTYFVGGFHDTTSDDVDFSDEDEVPDLHKDTFNYFRKLCKKASAANAHERLRRLKLCRLNLTLPEAKRHAEHRSQHPGETRPELGHASNSLSIVAPRDYTKGLFLDRRSFLTSYDHSIDPDGKILAAILGAVIPVCAGISLEYYFSKVDNDRYGCGTKTPHNVVGLLGVMNGARGDLRTGLVWQMVEYHEPRRIFFIIETTPENMEKIIENNKTIKNLVTNNWIYLAIKLPMSRTHLLYSKGEFRPFQAQSFKFQSGQSSRSIYEGEREQIDFAIVS